MEMFHASVEVDAPTLTRDDSALIDHLVEQLRPYHGVPFGSPRGYRGAALLVPAESITQAAQTAAALVTQMLGAEPVALEVMTDDEFHGREGWDDPIPDLMSVGEAMELLQMSRPGVLHRIDTGALQGEKIGTGRTSGYVLSRSSVEAAARREGKLESD